MWVGGRVEVVVRGLCGGLNPNPTTLECLVLTAITTPSNPSPNPNPALTLSLTLALTLSLTLALTLPPWSA